MTNRKYSEYGFWKLHISKVKDELERLGYEAVVCNRSEAGGTTPIYAARRCNAVGADLAVEFHFNGADTGIGGTETLYWYASKNGKKAAELIQAAMCDVLRLPFQSTRTPCGVRRRIAHGRLSYAGFQSTHSLRSATIGNRAACLAL